MTETEKSPELQTGISENESLALQVLVVATGFITLLYITSLAIDNDVKLSTAIAYAAFTYYFWNLYKGILGAPNVFKPQGEPIKLVDFAVYLLAGFTVSMVTISVYNASVHELDFDINILIPTLVGIFSAGIFALTLLCSTIFAGDNESWLNTIHPVVIYTTAAFGFWYLIKAVHYAYNAFKSRGNSDLLRAFTINLLVAIIVLSVAWYVNDVKGTILSQISSYASQSPSDSFYVYEIPIPESCKQRYGLN